MVEIPPDVRAKLQETVPGHVYVVELPGAIAGLHICERGGPWLVRTEEISGPALGNAMDALLSHVSECMGLPIGG